MKESYDFSSGQRGAVAPSKGKSRITIMLDDAVLEAARVRADEEGVGYQTLINKLLVSALLETEKTLDASSMLSTIAAMVQSVSKQQEQLSKTFECSFASFEGDFKKYPRYRHHKFHYVSLQKTAAKKEDGPALIKEFKPKAKPAGRLEKDTNR